MYPTAQMFFNAMRRKGYQPREEEMRTVVAIHNTVNERCAQSSKRARPAPTLAPEDSIYCCC